MTLREQIERGERMRSRKHRELARKESAVKERRAHVRRLERRRKELWNEGHEDRARYVTTEIKQLKKQFDGVGPEDLLNVIDSLEDRIDAITGRIKDKRRELERIQEKRDQQAGAINFMPGSPHWGGAEDIFVREVLPVAASFGISRHSAKRSSIPTGSSTDSDHYTGQALASAGDFAPSLSLALAIARKLGVPYYGYGNDYQFFYIQRGGKTFRVQIIASNHGTGPHLHVGIRRVS